MKDSVGDPGKQAVSQILVIAKSENSWGSLAVGLSLRGQG